MMFRKRRIAIINHPTQGFVFKLYRYSGVPKDESWAVLVTPDEKGAFENYWLDGANSWASRSDAEIAIQRAIETGEGL